jgi:hypothetical protein
MFRKEAENIFKYKGIIIEIQRMWKRKKVIPVIIEAPGTISKTFI